MAASSTQHVQATRAPLPRHPGQPQRDDSASARHGVSKLGRIFAPLDGWRQVTGTERRPNKDWAQCLKDLVEGHLPEAAMLPLLSDNLHPHKPAARYEAFAPQEARRIMEKIAWHHPPPHGSWLNMAEGELRVRHRQCVKRRIPDQETCKREGAAWEYQRNQDAVTGHGRLTTEEARSKLKTLYPSF
jgi:hypothetical protein